MIGNSTVIPRMGFDFFNGQSMSRISLEHESDKVFELFTEIGVSSSFVGAVALPEDIWSIDVDFVEKLVRGMISSVEGRMTSYHDKENYC